ncbi:hypothetical protein KO500_01525 [Cellulophaga baltica]|uniref:hypothetical protein n=1 Tax=Cellulophaga TaxID=104264 RepID=UPI001C06D598|nr:MULTISPECIES: hypothetical protein [Cellulophaga]MBU2995089.1 hypothetical protein [Cellulophaga baltica]MDO6766484.1 hypothetical protein [Cellulophaga sp. 1_MG-2023]
MAPINFEEHIKKQLDAREIKPSSNAWERISGGIETTQPKKKSILWYAIAASIIGVFISVVFFMNNKDTVNTMNPVVNENIEEELQEVLQKEEKKLFDFEEEDKNTVVNVSQEKKSDKINTVDVKESNQIAKNIKVIVIDSNDLAQIEDLKASQDLLIEVTINDLVAKVDSLELNNVAITDAEVDSLLRRAQDEILEQKLFKNTNKVDAMALLNEAENELDASFRDQLFDKLKNGYLKVRTALADRNN